VASEVRLPAHVAAAFGVDQEVTALPGTEGRTYRGGNVVLRQGASGNHALWSMDVLDALHPVGFRVERPIRARTGQWIVAGWSAWTFLEGHSATPAHAADVVAATWALHEALAAVPYASHLSVEAGFADRVAWDDDPLPLSLPTQVDRPLRALAQLRRPVTGLRNQVIHGDLNQHNILVTPGQAPGFIDFSPYWRPAEFAAAIAAYWLGPYQGNRVVLRHFSQVREFEQMLVRVAMRQLLRLVQTDTLEWAEEFVQAADTVYEFVR
jgi:uncharacterized protein (TIGR02569 family)